MLLFAVRCPYWIIPLLPPLCRRVPQARENMAPRPVNTTGRAAQGTSPIRATGRARRASGYGAEQAGTMGAKARADRIAGGQAVMHCRSRAGIAVEPDQYRSRIVEGCLRMCAAAPSSKCPARRTSSLSRPKPMSALPGCIATAARPAATTCCTPPFWRYRGLWACASLPGSDASPPAQDGCVPTCEASAASMCAIRYWRYRMNETSCHDAHNNDRDEDYFRMLREQQERR